MNIERFRISVSALSGESSIDILVYLKEKGWSIALDITKALGLHPTTVMGYLKKMHKAGIVSRRKKKTRTGITYEYKLTSPKIDISLDLGGQDVQERIASPVFKVISRIAAALERIGNPLSPDIMEDKEEEELLAKILSRNADDALWESDIDSEALFNVLKKVIEFSEKSLGKSMTRDIILSTSDSISDGLLEYMPDYIQEVIT
jgi:predicted transcriptional regulator